MIEHVLPVRAFMNAALLLCIFVLALMAYGGLLWAKHTGSSKRPWKVTLGVLVALALLVPLFGCDAPINPVRYQTVPVLVTRACFAGRTPPAEAATLTTTTCDKAGECAVTCTDARPEVCVTHATADILELQREARQYRNLFKECSK